METSKIKDHLTATATSSNQMHGSVDAIKRLKIDGGTISLAERDESPSFTTSTKQLTDLPPRTVVKILLQPAKGSNINVEIWLPDAANWNGRLLGLGNGGAAGGIDPAGLARRCALGDAVATTDMGTAPSADSGIGNREVWKDFGYRATHLMTVATKQVIEAYYGRPAAFCYFVGGSTGGQQAMQESQRYPEDYDGIVSRISAHCRTPLHAYFLWNHQILEKCPFSESQRKSVVAAGVQFMAPRETPPVAGKFVSDPRCDAKDIDAVIALALQSDPTLTPQHAEALRKLFDGPRHAISGERIFDGIPLGSAFDGAYGNLYLFNWVFGADKNLSELDFGNDVDTYTAALGPYLNAENPELSPFQQRGGKLLLLVGSADEVVPYQSSIDYYEKVIDHFGTLEKVQSFFKFFIVPGMDHGGGPGINHVPDLLPVIQTWRETGTAPEVVIGQRKVDEKVELEMPIYPYPILTGWDSGSSTFVPVEGRRGGIGRVSRDFLPPAAE